MAAQGRTPTDRVTFEEEDGVAGRGPPYLFGESTEEGDSRPFASRPLTAQGYTKGQKLARGADGHGLFLGRFRLALQGKAFAVLVGVGLLASLLMPDLWVSLGRASDAEVEVVQSMVLALVAFEVMVLSATDVSYPLSLFFFMDLLNVGYLMVSVSFVFGGNAAAAVADAAPSLRNVALTRAVKEATVSARAARLARAVWAIASERVGARSGDGGSVTTVISQQLNRLIASRVAGLTGLLVVTMPILHSHFPLADSAPQTWVNRLARHIEQDQRDSFNEEIREMSKFFDEHEGQRYGPYDACIGRSADDGKSFVCEQGVDVTDWVSWEPLIDVPPRESSVLLVRSGTLMVSFNMFELDRYRSRLVMLQSAFIAFAMVCGGLTLSAAVFNTAVRPLERMLAQVKQIASTVYKVAEDRHAGGTKAFAAIADEEDTLGPEDADDFEDMHTFTAEEGAVQPGSAVARLCRWGRPEDSGLSFHSASEMQLLEKVVKRLAIIADLTTRQDERLAVSESMGDEDIGILNMAAGKNLLTEQAMHRKRSQMVGTRSKRNRISPQALQDYGVSEADFASFGLRVLELSAAQRLQVGTFTIATFHNEQEGFVTSKEQEITLKRFVLACEREYNPNPFHSFAHAVDVTHAVGRKLRITHSEDFLTDLEQFTLLISAMGHDLGHPGVNNGFLAEIGDVVAIQYNDKSPLENMHCSKLFHIVNQNETNVFFCLEKDQFREVRKNCIEAILHTDPQGHQIMVNELNIFYQTHSELFESGENLEIHEVFNTPEAKKLVMDCILHSADVSNPCRVFSVTEAWAYKCLEEYFAQGDREKQLGIPVQFLNDREKLNRPNSQIGFIEFMIAPFMVAQIKLWPNLSEMGDHLGTNMKIWHDRWVGEVAPSAEEAAKVAARVAKVQDALKNAKLREGS